MVYSTLRWSNEKNMVHATVDILSLDRIQYESGNEAMITDQHFSDLIVQGQSDKDPIYKYMEKKH